MVSSVTVENPIPFEARQSLRIPLVGPPIQAGLPPPGEDWIENVIDLNEHIVSNPAATFSQRVKGNSMRGAGISSGDILFVDCSVEPRDRQIVVVMRDGDFTVKHQTAEQTGFSRSREPQGFTRRSARSGTHDLGRGHFCDSQTPINTDSAG